MFVAEDKKGKKEYYFTDQEYEAALKAGKLLNKEIHRNKGLGSLEPEEAKDSMFNPANQRLDIIEPDKKGIDLLLDLMGEDVQPRRDYIFSKIDFSEVRE